MQRTDLRTTFLDFLRILACFFVIVNHTCTDLFLKSTPSDPVWFLSLGYFFLAKTAVPIFFMISGYLLLGKQDSWEKTFLRIRRMLYVLLGCALFYGIYAGFKAGGSVIVIAKNTVKEIIKVYMRSPSNALWYLYSYIGILIMLPFLQKMAAGMERKDYHILFLFAGFFVFLEPILVHYSSYLSIHPKFQLPLFSAVICMLFLGQYFARFGISATKSRLSAAVLLLILCIAATVLATYGEYLQSREAYLFYDNIGLLPTAVSSCCIFYLVSCIPFTGKTAAAVSAAGACTFAVYLISDLIIDLTAVLYSAANSASLPMLWVILYEFLVVGIGFLFAFLLRKIPGLKKLL